MFQFKPFKYANLLYHLFIPFVKTILHRGNQQYQHHSIDKIYNSFGGKIKMLHLLLIIRLLISIPKVLLISCKCHVFFNNVK